MKKALSTILMTILAIGCFGCNWFTYPVYVLFGQTETNVKAEYRNLKNTKAAIFVVSRPAFDFEYPYASTNLALAGAHTIGQHVKNVRFSDQEAVQNFQFENLNWYSMPIAKIAERFDAQRLIYIDLYEYNMYEENSINLLRSRIGAEVRIYEIDSATPNTEVYKTDINVVVPEHNPIPLSDEALNVLQQQSTLTFAEELARKFYDHKKSIK